MQDLVSLQANEFFRGYTVTPSVTLLSTMYPSILLLALFLAQTTNMSLSPFVINFFHPLIMYPPSTFSTVVYKPLASDPYKGSLRHHPEIISKVFNFVKYFSFYASEANNSKDVIDNLFASIQAAALGSHLASSMIKSPG